MTNGRQTTGEAADRPIPETFMAEMMDHMMRRCAGFMKDRMRTMGAPPEDDEAPGEGAGRRCSCGECEGERSSTE